MFNLLVEDGYPKTIGLGEAAFNAVIGFVVVFLGISLLIAVVWLFGIVITKVQNRKRTETVLKEGAAIEVPEEDKDEITAVICAAVAAIYGDKKKKPEFLVRDTKRNLRG